MELRRMNKRGQFGLDAVRNVMLFALVLAVTAIAVFLALSSLQNASLFTANSQADNDTNLVINNITSGATAFFGNIPTVFTVLGAVVIILVVTLIIFAVNRFGRGSGGGSL